MKSVDATEEDEAFASRLARALWIEMPHGGILFLYRWSRLARALWIEMTGIMTFTRFDGSRLARALWIEINVERQRKEAAEVEARESLVD